MGAAEHLLGQVGAAEPGQAVGGGAGPGPEGSRSTMIGAVGVGRDRVVG